MALTAKKVYAILKRQISDMEAKLNSPVRYRGTVATADLLPLNPDIGDMYNIESKSIYGEAGMNVAWNGVVWDTMGAPIDMSLYIKSSELADWAKQPQKPDYTAEEVGALPANTKIPSKTSDLQNDSGFLTKIPDNYLSGTDKTLSASGKAADAKATGDKITELSADISNKLNKNQGSENSGKIAGINESGDIVPMFPVSVDYNEETNCLEFGSDQKMELNKGINLDSTLTKTGYAADAGAVGEITNSLKEDKINAFVTYLEYTSTEDAHDITISIPLQDGIKKYVEIQNIDVIEAHRYIGVFGNAPSGSIIVNQSVLLKANEKAQFEIPSNNFDEIVRIRINSKTKVRLFGKFEDAINNVIQKNNASKIVTYDKGYIGQDGGIVPTDGYSMVTALNIKKDDTIYFTGGYNNWCPLFGYYANGTAVPLLDYGIYTNKKISIKDENIVMVKGFAVNPNTANIVFEITEYVTNEKATTMQDCTYTNYNSTYISKTNDDSGAKFEVIDANGNMAFYNKKQKVLNGDYIFLKCEIIADKDCDIAVIGYSDATDQRTLYLHLEENKKSFITAKYNPCSKDGTLSISFQYIGIPNGNVKIEIQNFCTTINSMDCWYNEDTKLKLANYNTKDLYVSLDGKGHFGDINSAIMFAKNTFDVTKESVNIYIKNGVYNVSPRNAKEYPYAFVNKGANKINLIGEEVSHTIIKGYNSEKYQGKILDIGGDCYIKNLKILSLNDGTYTDENDMAHNCYCIHNDSGIDSTDNYTNTKKYQTLVENCNLYSECHSPVGAGLHNKQKQKYLNCYFTSNGIRSAGSLYVHASVEPYATDMSVEVDDCTCISKDRTKAIALPNTSGYDALTYADIPVTIRRTIGTTNGTEITNVSKSTHMLQEDSALNNVEAWNFN